MSGHLPSTDIRPADETRSGPIGVGHRVAAAIVLLGILLRAHAYVADYGLYLDEQLTALNVLGRSFAGLWRPLDLGQSAAPLFLIATKAMTVIAGSGPMALRFIPFAAGCAILPLFWWASRLVLRPEEALLALALLALSPEAIYYANFFKPYSSDALVTIALLLLAVPALDRRATARDSARRLAWLAVIGAVSVLFSETAIFVLGGIGAALLSRYVRQSSRRRALAVLASGALWVGLTIVLLNTTYSALANPSSPAAIYMKDFWRPFFLLNSLHGPHNSFLMGLSSLLDSAFWWRPFGEHGDAHTPILAGLLCAGILATTVRRLDVGLLLGAPIALLLLASALGRYPLGPRLTLFAAPVSAVGLAAAAGLVFRRLPRRARALALTGVIGVRAMAEVPLLIHPLDPSLGTQAPGFVVAFNHEVMPVYCRPGFVPAWLYYGTDWRKPDTVAVRRLIRDVDLDGPATLFTRMPRLLGRTDPWRVVPPAERWNGRTFLVGSFSGYGDGHATRDPAWADADAGRIAGAGPCTRLVLNDRAREENRELLVALHRRGATISEYRVERTWLTLRVCFGATAYATR